MKIAVVNDTVYPYFKGGAQKRVYEIARRLVRRGHEVHWYGMDYGHKELDGIRLHAVSPAYEMYHSDGRRRITQALRFAARMSISEKVDVIDCMNFPYLHCFPVKLSAMRSHTPLVITWFEFWGDYWYEYMGKLGYVGKTIEKSVARMADMIIADSNKVKSQLEQASIASNKIRVAPDGVDIEKIGLAEPSKDKYDVIYVGRMLAHKNVDVLLQALAMIDDITAVIIGDGVSRKPCEKLASELGLDKRVKFLGHVVEDIDVYGYMKSAKVLVLPSVQEGHPLVLPEAMACGIPVIGINGVCDEFIDHGGTGYLSYPQPLSIMQFISRAIELYPNFTEPCLAESEQYDWEVITTKVENVYRELV